MLRAPPSESLEYVPLVKSWFWVVHLGTDRIKSLPAQWYARDGARPVPSVTCHDRKLSFSPKCSYSVFCVLSDGEDK
jgi:hypothetical protein